MGRARAAERTEISPAARDLSAVVHSRRPTREASASMSQDRLLLRPADPTSRPRFHTDPGSRIDPFEERARSRSEEHTSELQSRGHLVCRLLLETKNTTQC